MWNFPNSYVQTCIPAMQVFVRPNPYPPEWFCCNCHRENFVVAITLTACPVQLHVLMQFHLKKLFPNKECITLHCLQ